MTTAATASISCFCSIASTVMHPPSNSHRHPYAVLIEKQRPLECDADGVADRQAGVRIAQRDQLVGAERHMQMVLIAEMLDPGHGAGSGTVAAAANQQVLSPRADGRSRGWSGNS